MNKYYQKYLKYKKKYLGSQQQVGSGTTYNKCCPENNTHFIAAHGTMLPPHTGFLVPLGVNIITITKLSGKPMYFRNKGDPILQSLLEFYREGYILFENNDKSLIKTTKALDLENYLNEGFRKTGQDDSTHDIFFKNHLPWPRQILIKHQTNIKNFINLLKLGMKLKNEYVMAYYFPEGVINLDNHLKIVILNYHRAPSIKPQNYLDINKITSSLKTQGYLGGSRLNSVLVTGRIIVNSDNLGDTIHNIPPEKLVLFDEMNEATLFNNTYLSFQPANPGENECGVTCLNTSNYTSKCCIQNTSVATDLNSLISTEGQGSYIIIACRGLDQVDVPKILRNRSSEIY